MSRSVYQCCILVCGLAAASCRLPLPVAALRATPPLCLFFLREEAAYEKENYAVPEVRAAGDCIGGVAWHVPLQISHRAQLHT